MNKVSAYEWGEARDSCEEALKMRKALGPEKTQADWYLECPRGDWLLWQFQNGLTEGELSNISPAMLRAVDKIVERAVRKYALPHPVTKSWAEGWLNGERAADASDKISDEVFAIYDATYEKDAYAAYSSSYAAYVIDIFSSTDDTVDVVDGVARAASSAARAYGAYGAEAYEDEQKMQADDIRKEIPVWKWDTGIPEIQDILEEKC